MIEMTARAKLGVRLRSLLEKFLRLSEVSHKPLAFSGGNHTKNRSCCTSYFLTCDKGFGAGIVFDLCLTLLDHMGTHFFFI